MIQYSLLLIALICFIQSAYSLVFQLPPLNYNVYAGGSGLMAWGDFGQVTEVSVYLAHGTPSNYTILQTVGEKIPSSTSSMFYHLPTTLPPTDVFFILEGNDSPKSVATRSVYVDTSRGGVGNFPSIPFPTGVFPSNFPFGFPSGSSWPTSIPTGLPPIEPNHSDGLPTPAIIGIAVGSFFFFAIIILTATIMRRRTIIKRRRAMLRQQQYGAPKPPPKCSEKATDINVNVAIQGLPQNQLQDQQQQQHTEYNYNYNPQYDYEQQTDISYSNQQPSYSSPGGFIVPSPKTSAASQLPTPDNQLHDISSPTTTHTSNSTLCPPAPSYQMPSSTKTSIAAPTFENKPNSAFSPVELHHKPNENHPSDKPHSNPTMQKPHSHSPF